MPRTLPWLKNGSKTTIPVGSARPSKRQRLLDPGSDSESTTLPRAIASPKRHVPLSFKKHTALQAAERSPSTSPPPEPPTEEPMRFGLSADDIYIMVEDEFLSVARTFTAHLHHAEYVRLKSEAKNRNSSTIPSIARPVDSITTMRAETKKKKEAEAQEARTKAGLESIKGPKRPMTASDGSDFDENEARDQPWEGTHLQRFMTTSPNKALTSLTGLQGVMSHTRAAAGFERSEPKGATTKQHPTPSRPRGQGKATAAVAVDETSEDDDDLDAPSRAVSRKPALASRPLPPAKAPAASSPPRPKPKAKPPSPLRRHPRRSLLDMTPLPTPISTLPAKASEKSRKDPDLPMVYEPVEEPRSSLSREKIRARRRRIQARKERAERESMKSGGGIEADEIPIFLV